MIGSPQLRLTWGIWPEMSIWQNWDTQLCCGVCRTVEACNLVARNACNEDRRRFSWEILSGKRSTNGQSNRWHIWRHIWRYNLTSCHAIQHDTSRLETMARNVWSSISQCNHVCNKSTSPLLGLGSVLHAGNAKIFHHFGCYPMLTSNQIMMIGPCHQQRLRREDLHKQGSEPPVAL